MAIKHKIVINVSDPQGKNANVLKDANVKLPTRLIKFLFGDFTQVYLLAPGQTVESVDIHEVKRVCSMSKVNISKIIEGVGACSENLIGISENLISISEKVSVILKVIVEIISEYQTEADKPAIETKTKKSAAKQIEAKAEPVKEAAKEYLEEGLHM